MGLSDVPFQIRNMHICPSQVTRDQSKNLPFMRLWLKVIKKMNVIRGDYRHSPSVMFETVSDNSQ